MNPHLLQSAGLRRSSTASSDNSPADKPKKTTIFKKLKTISSNGEWVSPEKRHFYEDLNVVFSDDPSKRIGVFQTDFYKVIRKFVNSLQRPTARLYYTRMEPNHKTRAQIAIVHGFGEHSGRFLTFGDFFAKKGFIVHLIDLSGFGLSEGEKRGSSLAELHQDLASLLAECESELPLFLMGHGFGAGVVLSFLINNRVRIAGVITTSAILESHALRNFNGISAYLMKWFDNGRGELSFNAKVNPSSLSKNNYNIRKYLNDPLLSPFTTLTTAKTIADICSFVVPSAQGFNYPLLMIHGIRDTISERKDSENFFLRCASKDKSFKSFEEGYHELHDDNELFNLQKNIYEWCKARSGGKAIIFCKFLICC